MWIDERGDELHVAAVRGRGGELVRVHRAGGDIAQRERRNRGHVLITAGRVIGDGERLRRRRLTLDELERHVRRIDGDRSERRNARVAATTTAAAVAVALAGVVVAVAAGDRSSPDSEARRKQR
jgi:hypothetical protein